MKLLSLSMISVSCFAADQTYLGSPSGVSCQNKNATHIVITRAEAHGFSSGQALIRYHIRGTH